MKAPIPAPLALPPAALAALGRRMRREWRATAAAPAGAGAAAAGGLAIRPRDLAPHRPRRRRAAADGRLRAGRRDAGRRPEAATPGAGAPPSRRFAAALHSFAWLPDLLTQGEAGAREGLRLWLEWRRAVRSLRRLRLVGPGVGATGLPPRLRRRRPGAAGLRRRGRGLRRRAGAAGPPPAGRAGRSGPGGRARRGGRAGRRRAGRPGRRGPAARRPAAACVATH